MKQPSSQAIAQLAYRKWEEEGHPDGRSDVHWREAEAELSAESDEPARNDNSGAREDREPDAGPDITNLEKALPAEERRRARARRHGTGEETTAASPSRFVVTVDHAHLKIYRATDTRGPSRLQLQLEEAVDFPSGRSSYFAEESDQAGRFPGRRGTPADVAPQSGGSIDERLPMQQEQERRIQTQLATRIDNFLQQHADAMWDYVAAPALHRAVFERLSDDVRQRVGAELAKDLVNAPVLELAAQVADAHGPRGAP